MPAEYGAANASPSVKLNLLGSLVGLAGVGRKSFTVGSGLAEYNVNKYRKGGEGHTNKQKDLAKDMKEFLGGQLQTIHGSEGSRELLTVAEEYGRRGSAVQLKTIIVDQVQNARASAHFRILRPRQMSDDELKGVKQEILKWAYTPPTEAPEFAPPHYLSFESELYEGQGYRFNNGFRFNAELLLTSGGRELLAQMARVAINNFVKLMEQIVTYCLMGVDDRYKRKKLLIDSGAQTEEELMAKYKYNGEMMGGSFSTGSERLPEHRMSISPIVLLSLILSLACHLIELIIKKEVLKPWMPSMVVKNIPNPSSDDSMVLKSSNNPHMK
jgi:hypothetical protein